MAANPLHVIMNPSSIAVVGASNNFSKMGTLQLLNIIYSGFPGEIFPVHPTEKEIFGLKSYACVADLPYPPALALLVVPTRLVPELLEDFGKLETRYAIIVSAGFKETGSAGIDLEQEIVSIAKSYGIRFVGPNCMGIVNTQHPLNISVLPVKMPEGVLSIASQSGTYITQTMPYLHRQGIAVSKAISVGNEANIDIVDCLEYLGEDDETNAICLYIEGIRRADRFLEVARRISKTKPIVAQYVGGTKSGARSGASHTGSLSGPDYVYDGLFAQAGVIRVNTIEEVYKIGWTLATQPHLNGSRIGVITHSGGPGTAIVDICDRFGMDIPELSGRIQETIRDMVPGHAAVKNPVDLTFMVDLKPLVDDIPRIIFASDEIDGVIIHGIMDTEFMGFMHPVISQISELEKEAFAKGFEVDLNVLTQLPSKYNKPIVVSSFVTHQDHSTQVLQQHRIPQFDMPEKAARAMAALYQHHLIRKRKEPQAVELMEIPEQAEKIMENLTNISVDEFTAKAILKTYSIPVTNEDIVQTLEQAMAVADKIGYPVALKGCSPVIQHKTEQGMVFLDINDSDDLSQAFEKIRSKDSGIPLLVSQMLKGEREFMTGISSFPGFPPCVLFGLGGIYTEALHDIAIRLAPLGRDDAEEMILSLSSSKLIGPYRGMPPVDMEALSSILMNLSQLAIHFPRIKEIDLNPIIVVNGKPKVADALFIMS
ncbi:MAG: acetate--CoA ligase family protein [Deltaproteobacteria bacterium]|nr:acetate--CoA ligase family protein [Deltaproteobacteria bacterium]